MPDYLHLFRFSILTVSGWILLLSVAVKFLRYRKNADKHRQRHPVATLTMIFCLVAFLPFLTFNIGAAPVPPPMLKLPTVGKTKRSAPQLTE